jgi:hypothetical protein
VISSIATSSPRIVPRSELLGYSELAYEVYEAGKPSNRCRVVELNEHRALTVAAIHLGISQEKLRAHRVPGHLLSAGAA